MLEQQKFSRSFGLFTVISKFRSGVEYRCSLKHNSQSQLVGFIRQGELVHLQF